jgi:hypothetical protein
MKTNAPPLHHVRVTQTTSETPLAHCTNFNQPADLLGPEPELLVNYIETCFAVWPDNRGPDGSVQSASSIRNIDLTKHQSLAIHQLAKLTTFIIRQEYIDFMAYAAERTRPASVRNTSSQASLV